MIASSPTYVEPATGEVIDPSRFVAGSRWRLARSGDHEYTVRDLERPERSTCLSNGSFEWFVRYVFTHGTPGRFAGRRYIYLTLDGYAYWSMGLVPDDQVTILNRRRAGEPAQHPQLPLMGGLEREEDR